MKEYQEFLLSKAQSTEMAGFEPKWMPDYLFPHQVPLVEFAIRKGKAALFEDCGLGKTPQFLVWAQNVIEHTNGRVLCLSPIAVSSQTKAESEKFGVETYHSRDGKYPATAKLVLTNYERLHLFDQADFVGLVCDESGILKNFDGTYRKAITEFARMLPYRLFCTATAAPNDYTELGTHSEALGELGYMDMLMRFFKNDQNTIRPMSYRQRGKNLAQLDDNAKWRFKGHAEVPFWQWVSSWARAMRKPSDLGFSDAGFELPALIEKSHVVKAETLGDGMLFALPAVGLKEQREERRRTLTERCERMAQLCTGKDASVAWCHLNEEGDLLEKLIPNCVQVSGKDSEDAKEEKLAAFASGQVPNLVTKGKIAGWGLNWQHCNHTAAFPSHSFEQYYQSVRRFWRFGQKRPVTVDIVTTDGELSVLENLQRKAKAADVMFAALTEHMNDALKIERGTTYTQKVSTPKWLS